MTSQFHSVGFNGLCLHYCDHVNLIIVESIEYSIYVSFLHNFLLF